MDVHEGHELPIERDLLRKYMCDSEGNLISQQTCRHHHHHYHQTAPHFSSARAEACDVVKKKKKMSVLYAYFYIQQWY